MSKTMTTKVEHLGAGALTRPEKEAHQLSNYWKALVPIAVGALLLLLQVPEGLKPNAWYYFALFVAVIIALILEPIPAAAVGLIGVTAATVSLLVVPKPADAIKWALSGFQDGTVWLIFVAFMFALGYEKTGLGRRVALNLVKWLGKRTLGLGYAVALADLVLAPFTIDRRQPQPDGAEDRCVHHVDRVRDDLPDQRNVPDRSGAQPLSVVASEDHRQGRHHLDGMVYGHRAGGNRAVPRAAAARLQDLSA